MSDWQSIKYRLIGATVIVVSFAFAWWLMLDHEVHRLQGLQSDIPQPMEIERFDIEEPQIPAEPTVAAEPGQVATAEVATDSAVVAEEIKPEAIKPQEIKPETGSQPQEISEKPVEKPAPKLSALDNKGLPEAWVLQVASFHEKPNAQQLQKKLVDKKIPAYVKLFNMPDGKNYRVLVGPKLSKEKAAQMAKKIEKEFGLKTMIVIYKPGFEE